MMRCGKNGARTGEVGHNERAAEGAEFPCNADFRGFRHDDQDQIRF